jgi:hypothetical protein
MLDSNVCMGGDVVNVDEQRAFAIESEHAVIVTDDQAGNLFDLSLPRAYRSAEAQQEALGQGSGVLRRTGTRHRSAKRRWLHRKPGTAHTILATAFFSRRDAQESTASSHSSGTRRGNILQPVGCQLIPDRCHRNTTVAVETIVTIRQRFAQETLLTGHSS